MKYEKLLKDNFIYLVCRECLIVTHSNMLWIDYGLTIHIVNTNAESS
jgi:hypothetical protein